MPNASIPATILAIDDDHLQLEVMSVMLSRHGHTVLRAFTGADGLRLLAEHPEIDLVLLDVLLPGGLDGIDVCRAVRANQRRLYVPIIMVTALGQTEQIAQGLEAGADDYVTKPFTQREILARVQAALRIRLMQRDLAEAQNRYQVLVETSRDLIFVLDASGRLTYVSPTSEPLTGYTPETLLADEQPFARFVHPQDATRVNTWLEQRLRRASDGSDLEFRVQHREGYIRWVNLSWSTMYDQQGEAVGLQGTLRDVTHRKEIEAATWRRSQELAALNLIATRISQSLELKPTLDEALDALLEVLAVEFGAIFVTTDTQSQLHAVRGFTENEAVDIFVALHQQFNTQPRQLRVARERTTESVQQIPATMKAFGIQTTLALPLYERETPNGVLLLASRTYDKFDATEVTLVSTVAQQISAAITNARLYENARQRADELGLLNQVSHMMTSTLDLEKVLRVIMEATVSMLQGEAGSVMLLDEATGELEFAAAVGPGAEHLKGVRLPQGAGIAGRAVREGRSLLIDDTQHDQRFYANVDQLTGITTQMLVATPLRAREHIIGVMEVINKRGQPFTTADVRLLDLLAPTAASAIENARLYAREMQLSDEIRRHNRELSVLHALSAALSESLEIQQVLDAALLVLQPEFEFDFGSIQLDELAFTSIAGNQAAAPGQPQPDRCAAAQRFTAEALTARAVRLLHDTEQRDPECAPDWRSAFIGAFVAVPLWGHDHVQGVLQLAWSTARLFPDRMASLLEAIGQQIGVAVERAHLYEVAQRRAVEIERSHRQLVQSEKLAATGRLAMSLAHEINNPLQAIQNCLHLVLEFPLADDRKAYYLNMAREEVERLSILVQNMLDFYRPSRSERPTADVRTVVERVLTLSEQKLRTNQIEVQLDFPAEALLAQIAPDQLGQVCLNLIMNAAEALDADGGTVAIQARSLGDTIETIFRDNGPGIAAADLPHIFEPFYTTKSEGTGLGLAISYTIIERHGGTLQVDSEPGRGAVFTLRLPKIIT